MVTSASEATVGEIDPRRHTSISRQKVSDIFDDSFFVAIFLAECETFKHKRRLATCID